MARTNRKPAFEQFRTTLFRDGKPLANKDFEPMRLRVIEALESTGHIVVQKARRTEHPEAILEVTATWTGIDTSPEARIEALEEVWPGAALPKEEELHMVGPNEEAVLLQSVAKADGGRYATAKVLLVTY